MVLYDILRTKHCSLVHTELEYAVLECATYRQGEEGGMFRFILIFAFC